MCQWSMSGLAFITGLILRQKRPLSFETVDELKDTADIVCNYKRSRQYHGFFGSHVVFDTTE